MKPEPLPRRGTFLGCCGPKNSSPKNSSKNGWPWKGFIIGCCVTMLSTSMLTTAGELLFTIDTSGFLTSPAAGREATASPAGFVSLTTPDSLSVYLVAIYEPAVPPAKRISAAKAAVVIFLNFSKLRHLQKFLCIHSPCMLDIIA